MMDPDPKVSSLVVNLGCVTGQVLVESGRLEQEDFIQKKALGCCLGNSPAAATMDMPPHLCGLLRGRSRRPPIPRPRSRAAGLRELAVPTKT